MDLTLDDFESSVDAKIVSRGLRYWEDEHVDTPEEREDGEWVAVVYGTDPYEVHITLERGRATRYRCTCPYDLGPVCKHVVATLYALRQHLPEHAPQAAEGLDGDESIAPQGARKGRRKQKTVAERIDEALATISPETAQDLLRRVALDYPEVRVLVFAESTSADGTSTKADYKRIIRESVRAARARGGFIDYRSSSQASRGALEVLDQAESLLANGRLERALLAYQAIVEQLAPVLEQADDSDGDIGGCIESALEGLQQCAQQADDAQLRKTLHAYCLRESQKDKYSGWGWEWEFLGVAGLVATSAAEVEELFLAVDEHIQAVGGRPAVSYYDEERAAEIKLGVLRRQGDAAAVEEFVVEHLHLPAVREQEIERAYDDGRLDDVTRLAHEGISQSEEQRLPGLHREWREWLLRVAVDNSDTNGIREHARELFLIEGRFAHYETLKETYSASEWPTQVDELLSGVWGQRRWYAGGIASEILIREERWEKLLDLASQQPSFESLDAHRKHLEPRFPEQMVNLYSHVSRAMLAETTGRATYQRACQLLRRIRSLGDEARVEELIEEFQEQYKRRRALLEELESV
ncbi:hypothetical protein CMK11_08560 [Candidatus Poribacteria bacterium]|jgi:hypothetical protein|nr:hypothetical protein [Candidatus Poribacteria bacterium]